MFELRSSRLRLIPLPIDGLARLASGGAALSKHLGIDTDTVTIPRAYRKIVDQALAVQWQSAQAHPEDLAWFTNWEIVLRVARKTIGRAGFAGPPDKRGYVFVAYWIDPRYQRQGYMTEALRALVHWSTQQQGVRAIGADVTASNIASQSVLARNGFVHQGSRRGHRFWVRTV